MGRWYLTALDKPAEEQERSSAFQGADADGEPLNEHFAHGVVVYVDPLVAKLRPLIDAARLRLADLEAIYTSEKSRVTALQAVIFKRLRPHFEERERLRLVVKHRRSYIKTLLSEGEEAAGKVREQFEQAEAQTKQEYEDIGAEMEAKHRLSEDEEAELKRLWRDLVKLFHPDRFASEPDKQETYTKLTGAINSAKDSGDLETLRKIAADPNAYVMRRGWTAIDLRDNDQPDQLQKLFHSLEAEILAVIESTEALKRSPSFELYQTLEEKPDELERVIAQQINGISEEVAKLKTEADKLKQEIAELSGDDASVIG
jgi:DNA polymerase-3 subunit epsilon